MRVVLLLAVFLLLLFCAVPVLLVVGDSFIGTEGGLSLEHYAKVFRPANLEVLSDSLLIATFSTLFALALGVPYAFFATRVRVPLRPVFSAIYVLPLVLPPLFMAMGWTQFLRAAEGSPLVPGASDLLGGVRGAAFLFGLAYFPFVTLFAKKAFLEIGAGFEEAGRVHSGALRSFFRITLPLSLPAILAGGLFTFLFTLADFSVVDYLSTMAPVEDIVSAYSFKAFSAWNSNLQASVGRREAVALGAPLALVSLVALLLFLHLFRKSHQVTMVSGHRRPGWVEDRSPVRVQIALRLVGFLFLVAVIGLAVGIPLTRMAVEANTGPGILDNLKQTLGPGGASEDFGNSLLFAGIAALVLVILAPPLAHQMVRGGRRWEVAIFVLAMLPLIFGPILFGAGLIRTWNHPWLEIGRRNPVYDTLVVVIFMLVGKYLPFALAAVSSSLRRVDRGYEEVAATSGVGGVRRLLDIVVPLSARGILGGAVLGFVFSLRELDTVVLLTAGNRTAMMKIYTMVHTAYDSGVAALSLLLVALLALPFLFYLLFLSRRISVL